MVNTCKHKLLSLQANGPLHITLCDSPVDSNKEVTELIRELKDRYVVLVANHEAITLAKLQLHVDEQFVESALETKYSSPSIPSLTDLIIWDFWSISYPLITEILKRPWKTTYVFAVYFDWGSRL
jgi:hypothetical protein